MTLYLVSKFHARLDGHTAFSLVGLFTDQATAEYECKDATYTVTPITVGQTYHKDVTVIVGHYCPCVDGFRVIRRGG